MNRSAEDFTPDPINLLESNRSLGYSIEEAVSDLIDNSVAAGAKNISFNLEWNDGSPYFTLVDDGKGMSKDELVESFKLGSKNPKDLRDPNDLGRFGCGMKTASLSQSRAFSVITKQKGGEIEKRCLDLDYIASGDRGWKLRYVEDDETYGVENHIKDSGTGLVWGAWDRCPKKQFEFNKLSTLVRNYVSVCFHKFMERPDNKIVFICNSTEIKPTGPIPKGEGAQHLSSNSLSENSSVKMHSYMMQNPSKWRESYDQSNTFNSFKLFNGFEAQQGIYIYRCDRLLNPNGRWLGVLRGGDSAKLARVTIEYPNDADEIWSLDITKTKAKIPFQFEKEIKVFVDKAKRSSGTKLSRGSRAIRENLNKMDGRIWTEKKNNANNSISWIVNPDHKFIEAFFEKHEIKKKSEINDFLQVLSDCLPVKKIIEHNDSNPTAIDRGGQTRGKLNDLELITAKFFYDREGGKPEHEKAFMYLMGREPFCYYESQLKKYLRGL